MDVETAKRILAEWARDKPLVGRLFIFGSRVRGEHHAHSDLDVAIELDLSAAAGQRRFRYLGIRHRGLARGTRKLAPFRGRFAPVSRARDTDSLRGHRTFQPARVREG